MCPQDMHQDGSEINPRRRLSNKFWFAVYQDVFDHEIVGMHVQPPKAADPAYKAAFPFMVWLWMCSEAAHREREVFIKGHCINLVRGQLVIAERYLAKKANWTRKAARIFLARLARHDMVRLSTVARDGQLILDFDCSKRGPGKGPTITVVTLCNYNIYQHEHKPKGTASGTAKGPTRDRIPTSNNLTVDKSHQSPRSPITQKDQSSSLGTDGTDEEGSNVVPLRRPMVMDAPGSTFTIPDSTRQKIEALGVDTDELLDRMYEQIDKGRRIGSKSRYLITSAINAAHERDGTSKEVLKAIISGNKFAKADAIVTATVGKPTASEAQKKLYARATAPKSNAAALLASLKR